MGADEKLPSPTLPWRAASSFAIVSVGTLSKLFLNFASRTRVHGLEGFLKTLEERKDVSNRKRGLITVSNHLSVVDDPLIWGVLPYRYLFSPQNTRWSLGSADICFADGPKSVLSLIFTLGQTLPAHRLMHSPYGGLYQPTMTQCIRLLSDGPFTKRIDPSPTWKKIESPPPTVPYFDWTRRDTVTDPFSDFFTYSTTEVDSYPSPSAFESNRFAWVHIFPEGRVHQHPEHRMRYFKWGISRLILESEPCPDVVPMFLEGTKDVMHEEREFPRFLPRVGKQVGITFGESLRREVLEEFRERWRRIREKNHGNEEALKTAMEAVNLRVEIAGYVRGEIEKLRQQRGYSQDDHKSGSFETWLEEGDATSGRKKDDSVLGNA